MVPKFILLFTKAGWNAQPYSINFGVALLNVYRIEQLNFVDISQTTLLSLKAFKLKNIYLFFVSFALTLDFAKTH